MDEWKKDEKRPKEYQCSKCGNYDVSTFPFCHWCGSKMNLKTDKKD